MRMGEPDLPALLVDTVNYVLRWHGFRVHVLMNVQADEVMDLATKWVCRMQLRALYEDKVLRHIDAVYTGDLVVVGQAEKVIPCGDILIQTLLRFDTAIRVGCVAMKVALHPYVAIAIGQSEGIDEGTWRVGHRKLLLGWF
jgi:hypothetical protein